MRTRTRVLLGIGATLALPILGILSLVGIGYGYMIYNIHTYTIDLRTIDSSAYDFCEKISHHPKFTKGPVRFRLDKGSLAIEFWKNIYPSGALAAVPVGVYPFHKTIILTEGALKNEYLDVIVAHELGHIQMYGKSAKLINLQEIEQQADAFAAEIVGTHRVLRSRLSGLPQENE